MSRFLRLFRYTAVPIALFVILFSLFSRDSFSPILLIRDFEGDFAPFECKKLSEILSKPLTYLGEGMQSIVFASHDDQFVLKFFFQRKYTNQIRFRIPFKSIKKNSRKKYLLERYDRAFLDLKDETGLIAVHLSSDLQTLPPCTIVDATGKQHEIDLRRYSFVVQKRGFPLESASQQLPNVVALEQLLESIASKGFLILGKTFNYHNYALVNTKPIMIDLGRVVFSENQKKEPKAEISRLKGLLKIWVDSQGRLPDQSVGGGGG